MNETFTVSKHITVSELNHLIKDVLNMGFPSAIWVCGEIQGYNRNKNRNHIFFELCEKDADAKTIIAKVGLVIFSGRKAYIREVLKDAENAFELKDDIEVKFLCKIDFYPPHGSVRLIVDSIDPIYTIGKIAQEKQRLIAKLKKDGTLEKNKLIPMPPVPLNIGLITAFDSAAYNDFCHELQLSRLAFKIHFKSALMQGKGTESGVSHAIKVLNKMTQLDCIVVTRGGGSTADLSWFDSEKIARAIAASRLPVLSGIGHEIDLSVTDLAAHTYYKTPTAVAQFLVETVESFINELNEKASHILQYAQDIIEDQNKHMKHLALQLQSQTTTYFKAHHQIMVRCQETLKRVPNRLLSDSKQIMHRRGDILLRSVTNRIKESRSKVISYERLIEMANPANTIKRGFSITRNTDGNVVRNIKNVKPFDELRTELTDGIIHSRVENAS